jgi:GT2 family glycosyltransferase
MKGWPQSLTTHTKVVEECPLLTAAVWMLKKSLYESVGGFDPVYVLGDFEDSDFCFKVLELGKTNYIHHGAELYHLERQSQNLVESGGWKHNVTILNALTFNKRWGNQISELAKSGADEIE